MAIQMKLARNKNQYERQLSSHLNFSETGDLQSIFPIGFLQIYSIFDDPVDEYKP
ncbi:MAG: hypothetical protein CSYNP_04411 [Syntrophus sp. SKADARSKE-3]|nr:hypothetical protein [Syntrophus sp. SKADARSKE-3]